jgi:glycosyltransferase involved in cell wall biosynthesis
LESVLAKKLNITFVISSIQGGGAERTIALLANGLAGRGHKVRIICLSKHEIFYELSAKIKLEFVADPKQSRNLIEGAFRNLNKVFKLIKILRSVEPDVIISFITQVNLLTILANLFVRKPLIISERANPELDPIKGILKIARGFLYRLASCLVVQTDFARNYFRNYGLELKKIHNPVRKMNLPENFESRKNIVLGVGRLSFEKGFDQLMKAFAKANLPGWKLWLVGDGCERQNLEALAEDLLIKEKTVFLGRQKKVENFYQEAGIFVLPSRHEGFPNALCEALAAGVPSIAFDCNAGPSEMIDDRKNGVLIPAGEIGLLADSLEEFHSRKDLRRAISLKSVSILDKMGEEKILSQWEELILRVMIKSCVWRKKNVVFP